MARYKTAPQANSKDLTLVRTSRCLVSKPHSSILGYRQRDHDFFRQYRVSNIDEPGIPTPAKVVRGIQNALGAARNRQWRHQCHCSEGAFAKQIREISTEERCSRQTVRAIYFHKDSLVRCREGGCGQMFMRVSLVSFDA